jgi:hypothetical protein
MMFEQSLTIRFEREKFDRFIKACESCGLEVKGIDGSLTLVDNDYEIAVFQREGRGFKSADYLLTVPNLSGPGRVAIDLALKLQELNEIEG